MTFVLHIKDADYGWTTYHQSNHIEDFAQTHQNNFWKLLRSPDVTSDNYSGGAFQRVGKYMYEVFE